MVFPCPPGTPRRAIPGPASEFFTNHETRNTAFTAVRVAMGTNGSHHEKPPPGHCFPASGRLAILLPGHCCPVHYCSPLFSIFFGGGAPSRCPRTVRTSNTACWVFHETRDTQHIFPRPSGDSKESNPKPGQRLFHETRDTNHGLYCRPDRRPRRPLTTSLRISTRPFLDIPGFLPPENGSLPRENGFLPRENGFFPPVDDFLPNHNESETRYFPQFVGMRRNSSDSPPSRCPRAVRRSRWQPVVKPRVAPRAARIAPLMAPCPADKERPGGILDIFDRGAMRFRRDASPLECSGAFAAGCWASRRAPSAVAPASTTTVLSQTTRGHFYCFLTTRHFSLASTRSK